MVWCQFGVKPRGGRLTISQRVVSSPHNTPASLNFTSMKILRVVGFGLAIVMLKFLVPAVFAGLENTLLVFFETVRTILAGSKSSMTAGFNLPVVP